MRYHYFTIEQRGALSREMHRSLSGEPDGLSAALSRLRSPEYGICVVCQGDIPFVRLMADPLARRCRQCDKG
jgi:RNA polymerase-binding transcription factor DksA